MENPYIKGSQENWHFQENPQVALNTEHVLLMLDFYNIYNNYC